MPSERQEIRLRIFVVGVPRSGTTLVQSLLAAHGEVASFTETHFFSRHFSIVPALSRTVLTRDPAPRVREFLDENAEGPTESSAWLEAFGQRSAQSRALLPLRTRTVARRLLGVLDELALRRGKTCWVEKTPRHLRYVPFLAGLSPSGTSTRFVHVIREGIDVVSSLHEASKQWERSYDLETCVKRWNTELALSVRRIDFATDHFVIYEDLTSRPESTLERLVTSLGLEWQPEMLRSYARASRALLTDEESWKHGVDGDIRRSRASERNLTAEERVRLGQGLRRDLYERLRDHAESHG